MPLVLPNRNTLPGLEIASSLLLIAVLPLLASPLFGQAPRGAGDEHASERFVLDPNTGQLQEIPPPRPGTDAGDLYLAHRALTNGQAKQAKKMLAAWLERYPDSLLRGEALLAMGDAQFALQNYFQAYDSYRQVLDSYPGGEVTDQAYERQLNLAITLLGTQDARPKKRKLWKIFRLHAFEEALEILLDIESRAPGSEWAEKAIKARADYHYRVGEFEEAEEAYARLARDFPRGPYAQQALLNSAWAAFAEFPGVQFDEAKLVEAEERFLELQRLYPEYATAEDVPAVLERIRQTRARKYYHRGRYYERARQPRAAAFYYRQALELWPDTTWAVQSQHRLRALGYESDPAATSQLLPATAPSEGIP